MTYYKFRGKGPRPAESFLGADGVFQLDLTIGGRREQKSLLFQAKIAGKGGKPLLEQAVRLSTWREAAFVLVYSDTSYRAVPLDAVLLSQGEVNARSGLPLSTYLGIDFLNCDVGDTELRYDGTKKHLIWRAMDGELVAAKFNVKQRITLKVSAPELENLPTGIDRVVQPDEIHDYRMAADDVDVLSLKGSAGPTAVNKAKRKLAQTYHPDLFGKLNDSLKKIMTRRMQEVNLASERLAGGRRVTDSPS